LTDMVMPEMSGSILAQRVRALRPNIVVLYMSGYTDETPDPDEEDGQSGRAPTILRKPFRPEAIAQAVRIALDTRSAPAAAAR